MQAGSGVEAGLCKGHIILWGYAHRMLEQYDQAIESYKQAIHFHPDYAEAHNHLGFGFCESWPARPGDRKL